MNRLKEGFTLIEAIFSISLLVIMSTILFPIITNTLNNQQKLYVQNEMYLEVENQMEKITSSIYFGNMNLENIISKEYDSSIESELISEDLILVTLKIKRDEHNYEFKKIFCTQGFYSN